MIVVVMRFINAFYAMQNKIALNSVVNIGNVRQVVTSRYDVDIICFLNSLDGQHSQIDTINLMVRNITVEHV